MFSLFGSKKSLELVSADEALADRANEIPVPEAHFVNGHPMRGPWPGLQVVQLGMGCFWGAERKLWQTPGVFVTSVGYQGGHTRNATYEDVCSGQTAHAEVVQVVYDPAEVSFETLLQVFWENHDPTQGMRQGADRGTQYRSTIYTTTPEQTAAAEASRAAYQARLTEAGYGPITTEIREDPGPYYFAEAYHQQYLAKNPAGYCGLGGTGVSCPVGLFGEG